MAMCSEDRISSLPDHILCHILSFLPLKEAVRTSIISTKWRYLFASISTIEFDRCLLSDLTDRNVDSFKNFVDRLLKFPDQVSLDCFRLSDGIPWDGEDHDFDVFGWICAALCRGVKEIHLYLDYFGYVLTVPAVLFTCHSLVTLKLNAACRKIYVPSDVCLGNLKTLQLRNSVVDGDSIHRLISNCHVLEDLAFIECHLVYASALNIKTPFLKRFVLDLNVIEFGDFNNVVVINAPNLEKADISIYLFGSSDRETSATHLIQGICTVRSLNLTIDDVFFRTCRLPIFHNLIEFEIFHNLIEFEYGGLGSNGRGTWLVEFLHCAPNLNTLTLNFLEEHQIDLELFENKKKGSSLVMGICTFLPTTKKASIVPVIG
ncbi:F-box/LRR-repeat protein At3g26922 isoform X2 [Gossypium raimondii]|uniref:F-box/LRR-repeat protein At3g26922 isoform X2 n=1 Tax=Gossypium raimondii TaxID=29730 RepID=UPI00227AA332|nr:F-box/LRR-repeat protein At3g26922 isoform X2 [Gossypium raimondii]